MSAVIELRRAAAAPESRLDGLVALTAADLERVNRAILARMQSPVMLIPNLAGHIVAAGGKRLRPMLTLAAAGLCGYAGERHIGLAACVEFIHTATLLHDDVIDESALRRGRATANAVWDNKASVLVGDFLFSRAFELMVEDGSLEVLGILAKASSVIAEGEVLQLMTTSDLATTEGEYLDVAEAKTARLFAAAAEIGAVVAGRPEGERAALREFGRNLGMAFQLADDALDYSARQARLGKSVGDDFREGKMTLPVVLAAARADDEELGFWRRTMEDLDQKKGDFRRAVAHMERCGALRATIDRAARYGAEARGSLAAFPDGPARRALADSIEFAIHRAY